MSSVPDRRMSYSEYTEALEAAIDEALRCAKTRDCPPGPPEPPSMPQRPDFRARLEADIAEAERQAFFRRQRRRDKANIIRVGATRDPEAARQRHEAHVADLIETFCPHEPKCEAFTRHDCPEGYAAYHRAVNAEYARRNARAIEMEERRPGGNALVRIRVLDRDSPEGQAELARRAARGARDSGPVDNELLTVLRGL